MTAARSLPTRPSLDSLRKQAKKLARDVAAGDATAVERVRIHLPRLGLPLTQRNAQLVIAREYGYSGWQQLSADVSRRLGIDLKQATERARRVIHANDIDGLKELLALHPALLAWYGDGLDERAGLLGFATGSYGDSFDPGREEHFTRATCAEVLIDAGAVVRPSVFEGLLRSRTRGLLQLFRRKGLLPGSLRFFAALGDTGDLRRALDANENDLASIAEAFTIACSFEHGAIAAILLDRAVAIDATLRGQVDGSAGGRSAFVKYFIDTRPEHAAETGLWQAFVMERVNRSVYSWNGPETSLVERRGESDLGTFVDLLHSELWLLDESHVPFQSRIIERATLVGRGEFITALLALDPAILRRQPPPPSQAMEFAFTYVHTHIVPLLARIWPLPDDLPHAAGMGDLSRVKRWFDESGAVALGDVEHYPNSPYMPKARVEEYAQQWAGPGDQRVLDAALAWSVMNAHFAVADFLLAHGANINTRWSSHEPASILHELVWHRNYDAMQFLIDRGIDMTIRDHRWNATAQGWAQYAAQDEGLAQWLEEAEQSRGRRTRL